MPLPLYCRVYIGQPAAARGRAPGQHRPSHRPPISPGQCGVNLSGHGLLGGDQLLHIHKGICRPGAQFVAQGRRSNLLHLPGLLRHGRVFLDGRPCDSLKLHGPATRPPEGAPPRLGLAAAVGAPGWAGAFMSVRVTSNDAWAALGPWLTAPERPPRLDRLTADGARLRFAAEARAHPLGAYPIAAQGDIIIVTADSLGGGALGIDGFGRQIGS